MKTISGMAAIQNAVDLQLYRNDQKDWNWCQVGKKNIRMVI